jgi:hypothetical protein
MHTPVRNESKQTTAQFPLWHLPLHCPSTRWRNFWGIILIPGPFRIQSHNQFWIILDLFYFIRNGAVWSCASIISACAVSFTLILLRDWHEWWVIQDWVSWGCLSMPESVRRPGPGGLPASLSGAWPPNLKELATTKQPTSSWVARLKTVRSPVHSNSLSISPGRARQGAPATVGWPCQCHNLNCNTTPTWTPSPYWKLQWLLCIGA